MNTMMELLGAVQWWQWVMLAILLLILVMKPKGGKR